MTPSKITPAATMRTATPSADGGVAAHPVTGGVAGGGQIPPIVMAAGSVR